MVYYAGYCKGKTPVVDEPNDGVSYTTWGRSLEYIKREKRTTEDIPWGRSLEK